ncbi:hypothetical protein GDO86_010110 [Hymenochirus boettgeri]|uniref:Golgi integral membrane protein 4 n=1 Tax=Hymenochirus boettgeri TaxID=247094 RepID=A0A8T2JS11_9PIPI|nr:hypothetical protein GDO86_010110 [Hymenochirus boettgeri]
MGNGTMCSRRQKRGFQALACVAVAIGFVYGAMLNFHLQSELRKAQSVGIKYQQHQESLSAQLQVVYEHRSRLEKSLQKERLEHKKAKEDFLVYKLEAQETLNKGRQDSNNIYNALSVQHQMLKSQHDELRKKHNELQTEHQILGEDLTKIYSDHKEKYVLLQQQKEQELSKLKESVYSLREENKHLRKAHQDLHVQLQDVKSQVEEFVQLKQALNKMPSLHQPIEGTVLSEERNSPSIVPAHEHPMEEQAAVPQAEPDQNNMQAVQEVGHGIFVTPSIIANEKTVDLSKKKTKVHKSGEDTGILRKSEDAPTEHPVEVEEEHKRELEEEEMEQVGKPERLVEEQDQVQEEQEQRRSAEEDHKVDENEEEQKLEEQQEDEHPENNPTTKPQKKYKSPYEEQLEQQQMVAKKMEEARHLKEQQDELHQQRLKDHILHQQQLHDQDLELHRQNKIKEEQLAEKLRKEAEYENVNHDIVHEEDEEPIQDERPAYDNDNHQDEAEDLEAAANNVNEEPDLDQEAESRDGQEKAAGEDVNPADDPNNQGEDEFEEAEQEREDENETQKQQEGHPEEQEHLAMAGNPDQQEDNIDQQYQEEGEEEVQEDLTEERKKGQNAEETYGDNEENERQIGAGRGPDAQHEEPKERNEDNYEEEDEEEEGVGMKHKQRAEMR